MMHIPKLALESAEQFIALVICWFLADLGPATLLTGVAAISPSALTLKDILIEEAIHTIIVERNEMNGVPLGLMCDRGEGEKKINGASFVKLVPQFDVKKNKVKVICIGIQSVGNFSGDTAQGVDHVLQPYDHDDTPVQFSCQDTEASGDGTRNDMANKLEARGMVKDYSEYVYTTCSLHAMNITLSSPTNLSVGNGGLLKHNALQCLHTAYLLIEIRTGFMVLEEISIKALSLTLRGGFEC